MHLVAVGQETRAAISPMTRATKDRPRLAARPATDAPEVVRTRPQGRSATAWKA